MIKNYPILLTVALVVSVSAALAAPLPKNNYVEFYVRGDCHQEDCIALFKDTLQNDKAEIVSMNLDALAPHEAETYRKLIFTFRDIKTAPYGDIAQNITASGYELISYTIHDTHTGKDIIVPH